MRKSIIIITTNFLRNLGIAWLLLACCLVAYVRAEESGFSKTLHGTFRISAGGRSGTCIVVATESGGHVLVTCNHAFQDFKGEACTVVLRSKNEEGLYDRKEVQFKVRSGKDKLWVKHSAYDIAALPIELPTDVSVEPISWEDLADTNYFEQLAVGDDVFIPGFPARMEANKGGWPIVRKGSLATYPLTPLKAVENLFINASTFGGDSGAPVIHVQRVNGRKQAKIVAMIWGMRRQTDRIVSPFEESVRHTPLDIATAVPSPYIRETIEQLK